MKGFGYITFELKIEKQPEIPRFYIFYLISSFACIMFPFYLIFKFT